MIEYKWFDVDDCLPEHKQSVLCITEEEWSKRYEGRNYGTPDMDDVEFGEHWQNGEVEIYYDMPMVKIKKWFPLPKL